jgi:lysozyme
LKPKVTRKLNQSGLDLIKSFEGCRLQAYPDPASPLAIELRKPENARKKEWKTFSGMPWTVGYGATGLDPFRQDPSGRSLPIGPSTVWTQPQADQRLADHVAEFSGGVFKLLSPSAEPFVSDNQFGALVSFAYNVGLNNLKNSTLLKLVNARKFESAAEEFLKWNKAAGKVLQGLTNRRQAERRLFLTK